MLTTQNLSCAHLNHPLFSNLSLELAAGELLLVEGPNGSGKSSLLRLLAGLATPSQGTILWQGRLINENDLAYAKNLHYLGHANGLKLELTVIENLQLLSCLAATSTNDTPTILSLLRLTQNQHTPAKFLSAGQKRRLALAKLFLFPKKLWILDEPFTALDKEMQALLLSQLTTHVQNGGISVMSSHQPILIKNIPIKNVWLGV